MQQLAILLQIQFFQCRQIIDHQDDMRQIGIARFPIGSKRTNADLHQLLLSLFRFSVQQLEQVLQLFIIRRADDTAYVMQLFKVFQNHGGEIDDIEVDLLR